MLEGGARGQYLVHHRFCLISWRLVDGWILYLICWFRVTQTLTWIYVCRSVTYISWSSDFVLYVEDVLMEECCTEDIVWYEPLTCISWIIYLFLPIMVCWYENICVFSKVRNRPVVYTRHEAGASVYFGHICSCCFSCFFFFQIFFLSDIRLCIFQTFNQFIISESWTAELWKSLSLCTLSNKSWTEGDRTKIEGSILWKTFQVLHYKWTISSESHFIEVAFCRLGTLSKDGFVEHFRRKKITINCQLTGCCSCAQFLGAQGRVTPKPYGWN